MSWSDTFLGVIALATLIMAAIQVGAIVAAGRIARQAQQTLTTVQQDLAPLLKDAAPILAKANAVAEEASRTAAIATAQAQKVDRLVTDLSERVEYTAAVVQAAIIAPAREGMALAAALKATLGALGRGRDMRPRPRRPAVEEDTLFIG